MEWPRISGAVCGGRRSRNKWSFAAKSEPLLPARVHNEGSNFGKRITSTKLPADPIGPPCDRPARDRATPRPGDNPCAVPGRGRPPSPACGTVRPIQSVGEEPIRKTVLTPALEDAHNCAAKACRVQHHELLHQDKIDKVLCATDRASLTVSSGVCVHLLCDVLFERRDWHFDPFDAGECQKIRSANLARASISAGPKTRYRP